MHARIIYVMNVAQKPFLIIAVNETLTRRLYGKRWKEKGKERKEKKRGKGGGDGGFEIKYMSSSEILGELVLKEPKAKMRHSQDLRQIVSNMNFSHFPFNH